MIRLGNDYGCGALPQVMDSLLALNMKGLAGYGLDEVTEKARATILELAQLSAGNVFFLTGGTQTNIVALDWLLRPGEGVLCSAEAHINVHEAGAIEACAHKVISIDGSGGKISADSVRKYAERFYADPTWPHIVAPGAVYITQPTETGALYSLAEIRDFRDVCDEFDMRLYVDGARLIYALGSPENDVSLPDLGLLTDAFYIGGTKCGTLFGEALVIPGRRSSREEQRIFSLIKRHGALLAKGWSAAVQFESLLADSLYLSVGRSAVERALRLRHLLERGGVKAAWLSPTNQQFFCVPTAILDNLARQLAFDLWGAPGDEWSVIRLVTDWNTSDDDIEEAAGIILSKY